DPLRRQDAAHGVERRQSAGVRLLLEREPQRRSPALEPVEREAHPELFRDDEDADVQRLLGSGRVDVRRDGSEEMVLARRAALKIAIFALALVPAALLVRGVLTGTLGVNPAETIQLETGRWTFKFLLLTLAVTPLRRLTGWNAVIQYRRMLGLFAFFYAVLHFSAYWA